MSHTFTIKPLTAQHGIHLTKAYRNVADMPPIPRQGDIICWDEDMAGQQVQRVEYTYMRGTGMGIIDKRRLYLYVTVWVPR